MRGIWNGYKRDRLAEYAWAADLKVVAVVTARWPIADRLQTFSHHSKYYMDYMFNGVLSDAGARNTIVVRSTHPSTFETRLPT